MQRLLFAVLGMACAIASAPVCADDKSSYPPPGQIEEGKGAHWWLWHTGDFGRRGNQAPSKAPKALPDKATKQRALTREEKKSVQDKNDSKSQ